MNANINVWFEFLVLEFIIEITLQKVLFPRVKMNNIRLLRITRLIFNINVIRLRFLRVYKEYDDLLNNSLVYYIHKLYLLPVYFSFL